MEDERCGFALVVARQCVARLRATVRWAPTDRQLADAPTKDCVTAVDMYQLSPEQMMLQRAADWRDRRNREQVPTEDGQDEQQVSQSPRAAVLNHNSVPVPFSGNVAIPSAPPLGTDVQVRSFLESLTTLQHVRHRIQCESVGGLGGSR